MKKHSRRYFYIFAGIITLIVFGFWYYISHQLHATDEIEPIPEPVITTEYDIPVDSFYIETFTVQKNDLLAPILQSLGATPLQVGQAGMLDKTEFDARNIRVGNTYKAFYSRPDSALCYFVYEKSPLKYTVFCLKDTFTVYNGEKEIVLKTKTAHAEIKSSLWNATVENGIDINLGLQLSEIYAWTIDFFGLQPGDRFTVYYDEIYVDTTYVGIGRIHAANFYHSDKNHYAFYYEQDSISSYWDEQGNNLKRAFLKAPLQFSRISSHFSYARKHPVLRIVRPHTGVDYAAPTGTPVMSIGDGTVVEKGYKGGGGNTIKIRHNGVYTTAYLHLSKFASNIREGGRVSQGQIIGYVGSTGLSTGPHLDFRVWKNNSPVNPLTIESPPVEPIHEQNKVEFDSISSVLKLKLRVEN